MGRLALMILGEGGGDIDIIENVAGVGERCVDWGLNSMVIRYPEKT